MTNAFTKTFAAVVLSAATLITPMQTAQAEGLRLVPRPLTPGLTFCERNPAACRLTPRPLPAPPAPAPAPSGGIHRDTALGIGIVGGIIAGAALANAARGGNVNNGPYAQHVNWCYNRYRSYREQDNSFMSNSGHRKLCNSPYL